MKKISHTFRPVVAAAALLAAGHAMAQVTFYEGEGFRGRAFAARSVVDNFANIGFNDRASSVVVERGRWEVCEDAGFNGRCVVLRPGSYDSLRGMGLDNRISSVRPAQGRPQYVAEAPPPLPAPTYEYRQRPSERLFDVPVSSVRAVAGPPEQRCWVERQPSERRDLNPAGGIIGGVLGGILGHQLGGGSGKTVTTIGGAVAGGALGANVDRIRDPATGRDVQRCENVASNAPPSYYDVVYYFRGVEHRVQMATPPGPTIAVNGRGEPRQ
ncbi:MAG TPA: beta/gamma crystallin-related protein [Dokdonella sp.]